MTMSNSHIGIQNFVPIYCLTMVALTDRQDRNHNRFAPVVCKDPTKKDLHKEWVITDLVQMERDAERNRFEDTLWLVLMHQVL